MTEEYKKNLIDYATGNITPGTPTTDEIIKEIIEANRSDWINNSILPNSWKNFHYEGLIREKNSENLILYGGYRTNESTTIDNEVYGIITLLDSNFKPIKSFFEDDNGTKLRYIQKLEQAEDNSFYMVDDTIFAFNYDDTILTSTKRLVILNNFAAAINNEYRLILRSSYIFPAGYNTFLCENLTKNPNKAQYVMVGKVYEDAGNNYLSVAQIELDIPYGSSVEWDKKNIITYVKTPTEDIQGKYLASFVKYEDDDYKVNVLCGYFTRNYSGGSWITNKYVRIYARDFNSSTYTYSNILTNPELYGESLVLEKQSVFVNENLCYFVLDNINNTYITTYDLKIQLWEYNLSNSSINKIYEKSYGTGQPAQQEQIFLSINQGDLYIEHIINKTNNKADYYIQRYEGEWNPILISEDKTYAWNQRDFYVSNNFNLIKLFLYPTNPRSATWYFPIVKEIYNSTQYNGEPYVSEDSLSPLYSNLYSNGSIIFSRNLYNISKQNNMTMSSVEIPNTYLNDITINQNDLISKTNLEINNDTKEWTKNIYEVVDVNFLNTISVINEDTGEEYMDSAIKLNNATTDGGSTNYQNTPCNKFRINYGDGTSSTDDLSWTSIDDTHKETQITFYVDKAILSIDLLSHDTTTIYLHIPVEVEIGKTYSISQKIRIGG
jgi:hypothetical protein